MAGNPGGPGNPHAARVGQWRSVLVESVTPADLRAVIRMLLEKAKAGERWAVCELLDRTLGRSALMLNEPESRGLGLSVDLERLKELTAMRWEERRWSPSPEVGWSLANPLSSTDISRCLCTCRNNIQRQPR